MGTSKSGEGKVEKPKKREAVSKEDFFKLTKRAIIEREAAEPFLKSVGKGVTGEAKVKASLLAHDLWVLERSVDVNGADFIVQEPNLSRDLHDIDYPPVAFVQVKNYSDSAVELDARYVYYIYDDISPREDFFVFIYYRDKLLFLNGKKIDEDVQDGRVGTKKDPRNNTYIIYSKKTLNSMIETEYTDKLVKIKDVDEREITERVIESRIMNNSIKEIKEVLKEKDENPNKRVKHFLGQLPTKEESEHILEKALPVQPSDELVDTFNEARQTLYAMIEYNLETARVFREWYDELANNPEEWSEEEQISNEISSIKTYKWEIRKKWLFKHNIITRMDSVENTMKQFNKEYLEFKGEKGSDIEGEVKEDE